MRTQYSHANPRRSGCVFIGQNLSYEARRQIAATSKHAIGIAAAALIPNNSSLFINVGTTTEEVAKALTNRRELLIITNNINVALTLHPYPALKVVIAGGLVRPSDGAVVGSAAVDLIRQFKVDSAIIGASAIDEDGTLLDFDPLEVTVARAIIENARRVLLVCDATKVARAAPVRIGHMAQINTFITDRLSSDRLRAVCAENRVQVIKAYPRGSGAWSRAERPDVRLIRYMFRYFLLRAYNFSFIGHFGCKSKNHGSDGA